MLQDFEEGNSNNLPSVDMEMILFFYANNQDYVSVEGRGQKNARASRPTYGDKAIGFVQVRRNGDICTVKAKITPEHKVRAQAYNVTVEVDEREESIVSVQCEDCVSSVGGCKHAIALAFWLYRRSEEPSVTEVASYWKRSSLSKVGTIKKFVRLEEMCPGSSIDSVEYPEITEFINNLSLNETNVGLAHIFKQSTDIEKLSLHHLYNEFSKIDVDHTADNFIEFCKQHMPNNICNKAEVATRQQSHCDLWHELRYGRITASKIFEASRCKVNGSLVESIFGARKLADTLPMKRGRELEEEVLKHLSKEIEGIKFSKVGLKLSEDVVYLGASPDAVSDLYCVEVKCPFKEKTIKNYLLNDVIKDKYFAQLQLQMHIFQKEQGIFVIADPNFESNKKIVFKIINYDKFFCDSLIKQASEFWKKFIFPNFPKIE